MTGPAARQQKERAPSSDEKLIKACLKGDSEAWAALIDKYKNLIYSIPVKFGMYQDAGDIFQAVCVDLMSELPNLREHRALPKWLIQTCYHRCLQHRRAEGRHVELEPEHAERPAGRMIDPLPEQMLVQLEQEQMLRDVVAGDAGTLRADDPDAFLRDSRAALRRSCEGTRAGDGIDRLYPRPLPRPIKKRA